MWSYSRRAGQFDGIFFENLDPYVTLRLLAENPANLDVEVQWRFADLVEGRWAKESSFYEDLSELDRYLIVTEGSSDGAIIRKAMELLRPDIVVTCPQLLVHLPC